MYIQSAHCHWTGHIFFYALRLTLFAARFGIYAVAQAAEHASFDLTIYEYFMVMPH